MDRTLARRAVQSWDVLASGIDHTRAYRAQRADALRSLGAARRNAGAVLTPDLKRACDQYARDVLGSRWHAPGLYVYAAIRGRFVEGWIPDSYMGRWVAPAMSNGLPRLSGIKTMTRRLLPDAPLPDIAYLLGGAAYDRDLAPVDIRTLAVMLEATGETVIVKRDGGYRGFEVREVTVRDLVAGDIRRWGNAVVQRRVRQHDALEAVVSGSVATYRIVTVREPNGAVTVRYGVVKFGRAGHDAVRAGSSYLVAVVDADGTLNDIGHTDDWRPSPGHPDTNRAVPGGRLPQYREATRLCRELHDRFPHFGLIGWDVTVDDQDEIRVLEWNAGHIGVGYSEAILGPSFGGLGWEHLHR